MNALALQVGTCPRCESPIERGDLRCAVCAYAVAASASPEVGAPIANVVRCGGCGACVSYDVAARAPRCAFCSAVTHVESIEDPPEQATAALPFAIDPDAARAALFGWLGTRGFFCPSDVKQASSVDQLKPLWWPAWVVDVETEVSWTADSNAGARRSAWAPHAGATGMRFASLVIPASRGLSGAECSQLIPGTSLETASPSPTGPDGVVIEQFDIQRSSARSRIVDAVESVARANVINGQVPGSRHRNVHVSVVLRGLQTQRLSIPAYVLGYRYRDTLYRAVVHGQNGRVIGSTPTSWWKVLGVTLAVVAGLAAIAAIALS